MTASALDFSCKEHEIELWEDVRLELEKLLPRFAGRLSFVPRQVYSDDKFFTFGLAFGATGSHCGRPPHSEQNPSKCGEKVGDSWSVATSTGAFGKDMNRLISLSFMWTGW